MADKKKYLRVVLGECRASLTPQFARSASVAIQRRLLGSVCYRGARAVVLYASVGNEVATGLIASDAIAAGKEVFFPRLDSDRAQLTVARVRNLSDLTPGAFAIPEPPADAEAASPAELAGAMVCVPGVAFGPQGQRLGRGGGHYDRFIAALPPEAITVGLAYSFQSLDRVPEEPSDQRLQFIVTESALMRTAEPRVQAAHGEAGRGGTPGWN
ncbi:MAG TPA: 5-formyltetrahydrofolate cyclo-ligase [Candidatus Binataceae bacterium]|nr:5-formyltetrahydrofolate cyclo-ligase [Candidatus Binataceae bacterium]